MLAAITNMNTIRKMFYIYTSKNILRRRNSQLSSTFDN